MQLLNNYKIRFILPILALGKCWAINLLVENKELNFTTNKSFYSMDALLIRKGYNIQNVDGKIIFLYKNKEIPTAQLLGPIGKNKAIKLFISLKNTLKNSNIYLNDSFLDTTNNEGVALIDKFYSKGNYMLSIKDQARTLNYILALEQDLKLECSGYEALKCNVSSY